MEDNLRVLVSKLWIRVFIVLGLKWTILEISFAYKIDLKLKKDFWVYVLVFNEWCLKIQR